MIDPTLGAKLIYIFGIINIIGILLVFFSCRCLAPSAVFKKLAPHPWFQKFYQKHCVYWWIFVVSVLAHTILAFMVFGNPLF